ncbi:hypothetical protein [Prosthecobacter sp.]|uniref:hypothetical protein n=1 Tax=Prosthecobacter sp. TaxID=1965333 RepID=UPI001D7E1EBD|nr:hypothetical protein [Prosthecobacter sp.]MCB1275937.1 hypothetical protein [Prosthecobacter sp.]
MKTKSKKVAPKKNAALKDKAKRAAPRKKTPNAVAKKKAAPPKKKKNRSSQKGIKVVTREYWVVRATRMPLLLLSRSTSNGKPRVRISEDEVWIDDGSGGPPTSEPLPYLLQDDDTICTYNPGDDPYDPTTVPEIESFAVDCYESDGSYYEDVIEYDYSEDYLSVDLSVLEEVTEESDPQTTGEDPYTCTDDNFSIGIEG